MTSSQEELKQIARSQKHQQIALTVLSVVVAVSTFVMWRAGSAMREANDIQRQMTVSQKSEPARKAASARKPNTHASNATMRDPSQRSPSAGQNRIGESDGQAAGTGNAHIASTNPLLARPGRQ